MTDQEIEELQKKLGPEYSVKRLNGAVTVELVDIWKGVEFAEAIDDYPLSGSLKKGMIYKVGNDSKYPDHFRVSGLGLYHRRLFTPSTESPYVDQLKSKAKELYGEIKEGDCFDASWFPEMGVIHTTAREFYDKHTDQFHVDGFPIYSKGRWAGKVFKPETVEIIGYDFTDFQQGNLSIQLNKTVKITDPNHFIDHLENAINGYLKNEQK